MASPQPAILLERVCKAWPGASRAAVQDVSLAVAAGSLTCLVGASGSGKTTTLKMINRLIEPDAGRVEVEGRDVSDQPAPQLRRRIGYAFQGVGLFPHLSVGENIAITPGLLGWDKARIAARVDELLQLVGLPQAYAARAPAQLSGGERQRIGVARAMAAGPKVMLMDEPFGALDPVTREGLGRAYRDLHRRLGLTTVMVTHDVMEAVVLADRIVVMDRGGVIAEGTPAELMAGTDDPAAAALMDMPRRQAEAVQRVLDEARAGPDSHG